LVEALIGFTAKENGDRPAASNGQTNGSATAPSRIIPDVFQTFEDESNPESLPSLPANPTREELLAYANAHPTVRNVLKIFRGKIVEIEKRQPSK